MKKLILLCVCAGLLSGCSTILSHSQTGDEPNIHAKRSLGTALDDNAIVGRIEAKIRAQNEQFAAMIHVDSYNRVVLLTGRVPDQGFIDTAIKIASKAPGVRQVHSEIDKGQPTTMSHYWYDVWLTTKVKSQLTLTSNVPSSKTKVRSFAGYVYLMGVMTEQEAQNAVYIASRTPGAKKIVSLIESVAPEPRAQVAKAKQRPLANQPEPEAAVLPVSTGGFESGFPAANSQKKQEPTNNQGNFNTQYNTEENPQSVQSY